MANTTGTVDDKSIVRADFIQELLPSAERTALLYHLTFLNLGGFPKLEREIKDQAIETQLLFGSSQALLLECVGMSSNLVTNLFPMLKTAVEENKPDSAVMYLEEAKKLIADIIVQVDDIVKRYDQHNISVKTCISDVYQEQAETKEKIEKNSYETKVLENTQTSFKYDMKAEVCVEIQDTIKDEKLDSIDGRFQEERGHWTKQFLDFFRGYRDAMKESSASIAMDTLLYPLDSEKSHLKNEEWNIKIKLTDLQLQLASGEIPNPDNLKEVQLCLSRIQQILVGLKCFWEKVDALLKTLKNKSIVGEEMIEMEVKKDQCLKSIEDGAYYWERFGMWCQGVQGIFCVQSIDAYKFLEISPSSLSEEERNQQYLSIMEKLKKINPEPPALSDSQI